MSASIDKAIARPRRPRGSGPGRSAELVEATGLLPGHRPPPGRRPRGPRAGAARRRRPLRPRRAADRARAGPRPTAMPAGRRPPARRWPSCATRPARACSSTSARATGGSASPRWSRPTACARSCPMGASLPLDVGSAGAILPADGPCTDRHRRGWVESVGEREAGVASVSAAVRGRRRPGRRRGQRVGPDRAHDPPARAPLRRRGGGRGPPHRGWRPGSARLEAHGREPGGHRHRHQLDPPGRGPRSTTTGHFEVIADEKEMVRLGSGGGDMKELDARRHRPGRSPPSTASARSPTAHDAAVTRRGHQRRARGGERATSSSTGPATRPASRSRSSPASRRPASSTSACCRPCRCSTGASCSSTSAAAAPRSCVGERGETLAVRSLKLGRHPPDPPLLPTTIGCTPAPVDALPPPRPVGAGARWPARSSGSASRSPSAARARSRPWRPWPTPPAARTRPRTLDNVAFTASEIRRGRRRLRGAPTRSTSAAASRASTRPGRHHPRRCHHPRAGHGRLRHRRAGRLRATPCARACCSTPFQRRRGAGPPPPPRPPPAQRRCTWPSSWTTTRSTRPTSPRWPSSCSTSSAECHGLGDDARELLEAAALLANVGLFVSHARAPQAQLLRDPELRSPRRASPTTRSRSSPWSPATTARAPPKAKHAEFAALDAADQAGRCAPWPASCGSPSASTAPTPGCVDGRCTAGRAGPAGHRGRARARAPT